MTALAERKADQARIWGAASWEDIAAQTMFPVHDELTARLAPRAGERWLDYFERRRTEHGISAPRPYLIIVGRRRD
jgi:hypothetical protein